MSDTNKITDLYCRLSHEDELEKATAFQIRKIYFKNMPMNMDFTTPRSTLTTGTRE